MGALDEQDFQFWRSLCIASAAGSAFFWQHRARHSGYREDWRVNVGLWLSNAVVMAVICGACGFKLAGWLAQHEIGLLNQWNPPREVAGFLDVFLGVAALDLGAYLWHRFNHYWAFLWRFHRVHHSDRAFTTTTAVRFHPGEVLLALPARLAIVCALGLSPITVLAFEALFALSNFFVHSDIRLPERFEIGLARVLVVPALHRRHHGSKSGQLGSNFGTIFSTWDRCLGSFGESHSGTEYEIGLPGHQQAMPLGRALWLPAREVRLGR